MSRIIRPPSGEHREPTRAADSPQPGRLGSFHTTSLNDEEDDPRDPMDRATSFDWRRFTTVVPVWNRLDVGRTALERRDLLGRTAHRGW